MSNDKVVIKMDDIQMRKFITALENVAKEVNKLGAKIDAIIPILPEEDTADGAS